MIVNLRGILSFLLHFPSSTHAFPTQIGVVFIMTTTYGATFGVIIIIRIANAPCSLTNY